MIERNEIESVWFIENNELKNANRVVTKLDYKGQEITILKSEREWIYTDLLIKDNNQVYWNLGIAPAKFQNFIDVLNNQADTKTIEYCNDILFIRDIDLKKCNPEEIKFERNIVLLLIRNTCL